MGATEIEQEFDHFFDRIGYRRVGQIVGDSPNFDNADYISYDRELCVELKVLDKDFFKDGGIVDSMRMIVGVPKNVDEEGLGLYTIKFPEPGRNGRPDTIQEPLRQVLKKANRQLRETNKRLLGSKGHGLVMLALNMTTAISPVIICNLVHAMLCREFTSVSGVMICNPKVSIPLDGQLSRVFLHTHDGASPETVLDEIVRIGNAWCDFANAGGHGDEDELDKVNRVDATLGQIAPGQW